MFGIKGVYGENFVDEVAITATVNPTRAVYVGGTNGSLKAQVIAGSTGLKIASGKKITLTATECDTKDGSFANNGITVIKTMDSAKSFLEGDIVAEFPFESGCKKWAKLTIACDDTTATGKIKAVGDVRG